MNTPAGPPNRWAPRREWALAGALMLAAALIVLVGAERLPLDDLGFGADWRAFFWGPWQAGELTYTTAGLYSPPWTMWLLRPLALLPFRASWAVWTLLTAAVLVASVPRRATGGLEVALILALMCSFWTVRHLAEGNLAALLVGGGLLLQRGYQGRNPWLVAVGAVLITAKIQEGWLVLVAVGLWMVRLWPPGQWLRAAAAAVALMAPAMLVSGEAWLASAFGAEGSFAARAAGTAANISWLAVARGVGLPEWVGWGVWLGGLAATAWVWVRAQPELTPELLGLLTAASLLWAPYAGGAGLPVVLALGLVPLWRRRFWLGLALWLWGNSAYLAVFTGPQATGVLWPDWVQMALVALVWAGLLVETGRARAAQGV